MVRAGSHGAAPLAFRLLGNYPNPFNPSTTIRYETANTADVSVRIFDLRGALIIEGNCGHNMVFWKGRPTYECSSDQMILRKVGHSIPLSRIPP
jgi:hypothetical protein